MSLKKRRGKKEEEKKKKGEERERERESERERDWGGRERQWCVPINFTTYTQTFGR